MALDMGGGVKCVDVCSPYVIVLLMEGEIGLLKLVDESLVLSWPSLGNVSITHCPITQCNRIPFLDM